MKLEWPNFKREELVCSCCGRFNESQEFQALMDYVQVLRWKVGTPLSVSSAYRCPEHPIEAGKEGGPGYHSVAAVDLKIDRKKALTVLREALKLTDSAGNPVFTGVGVQQKGSGRFIHLDMRGYRESAGRIDENDQETMWSY